jgi:hypothetical protein
VVSAQVIKSQLEEKEGEGGRMEMRKGGKKEERKMARKKKQRKKEPSTWGYNWATLFLGDINTGSWTPGSGSLKI